jgi:flagellar biosynthesis protein FlhG
MTILAAEPQTRPLVGAAETIAIASGKGGVGKTWFAITLAHAWARMGRRVLLFDADAGLANVDVQLGLVPAHDLRAVLAGTLDLGRARTPCEAGGFDVLAGSSGTGALAALDAAALARLLDGLRALAPVYDAILLDLGAGVGGAARRAAAWADRLVVLATDEPTSLTDAYAVMKLYAGDGGGRTPVLVVNQARSRDEGLRTVRTLRRACAAFLGRAPDCAGIVRRDERVRDAIRRQQLLLTRHPGCAAASDMEAVAHALLRPPRA